MIRGSAERDGRVEEHEPRQTIIVPAGVFRREEARQPVVVSVVVIQLRLQAHQPGRRPGEPLRCLLELVSFGPVLGIEDDQVIPGGPAQTEVAGLRLRPWLADGHEDDFERRRHADFPDRLLRVVVVRFHQQQNLQALRRIVHRPQVRHQSRDRRLLVIERHHDGVGRPAARRHGVRVERPGRTMQRDELQRQLVGAEEQVEEDRCHIGDHQRQAEIERQGEAARQHQRQQDQSLLSREHRVCAEAGVAGGDVACAHGLRSASVKTP